MGEECFSREPSVTLEPRLQQKACSQSPVVQTLGVAIYRALDWGLDSSEERELSPQLECLIEGMVGGEEGNGAGSGAFDEGYSEPEAACRPVCSLRQVMALCSCRLVEPSLAPEHYQAVVRALFVETLELQTFLQKIRNAKQV
uniref:KIND domain-containing protein n=1 Tax=Knipowitschia caucasica TaxID=637954 RepID=A0AAV2KTX7_KNICA